MTKYIVDLTNQFIGEFRFDDLFRRCKNNEEKFLENAINTLAANSVSKMNPETLGRILCAFEIGDIMLGKKGLFERLHFSGDVEETIREMLVVCLAKAIYDRLDPRMALSMIPSYEKRKM